MPLIPDTAGRLVKQITASRYSRRSGRSNCLLNMSEARNIGAISRTRSQEHTIPCAGEDPYRQRRIHRPTQGRPTRAATWPDALCSWNKGKRRSDPGVRGRTIYEVGEKDKPLTPGWLTGARPKRRDRRRRSKSGDDENDMIVRRVWVESLSAKQTRNTWLASSTAGCGYSHIK